MLSIAVYAIAKNESKHVERFMENFKRQDVTVFVLDTGSDDNTVEQLTALGAVVGKSVAPYFDFASARNEALHMVPATFDICMAIDLDEVIEPGFAGKIRETFSDPEVGSATLDFVFSRNTAGDPTLTYKRNLIHRRDSAYWRYPAHEVLVASGKEANTTIVSEHLPDLEKPRDYLPLLQQSVQQYADHPRPWFYLAREYMHGEQFLMSIKAFETCLSVSTQDTGYLFDCLLMLGDCYKRLQDFENAEHCYRQAIVMDGDRRDGLMSLSQLYFEHQLIEEALGQAIRALRITKMPNAMFVEQSSLREWPYHMAAVCYDRIGGKELACKYITIAQEMAPLDGIIAADYATITGKIPPGLA